MLQKSYGMVSDVFQQLKHQKGVESELSEMGDSVASKDGVQDALGLVTGMMVTEPDDRGQRAKLEQLFGIASDTRSAKRRRPFA